jgi:hypothetical protein
MCHFITATLPPHADLKMVRTLIGAHKQGFTTVANEWVQRQLLPGEIYLCLTRRMCDCGTALGCVGRAEEPHATPDPAELERLRREGWSEARIARRLAEQERTAAKREREVAQRRIARVSEAEEWRALLAAILERQAADRFGLLLHWYRSAPETERIELQRREKVPLARLTPELLMEIEEDVLYEFAP